MEGKSNYFILLIIVVFLSLTLAILTVYIFFVADKSKSSAAATTSSVVTVPSEKELGRKTLFDEKQYYNLKNADEKKISVIQVDIELTYYKGKKEATVTDALKAHDSEIKELIGTYFQNKTLEEVKLVDTKEKAKKELKEQINKLLTAGTRDKTDIIYNIAFKEWFYQ